MTGGTRLVVAPRAREQIAVVGAWWRANREAAPGLFAEELANTLERLTLRPERLGSAYTRRRNVLIRRVLLPKTRYHVYFSYGADDDMIEVRAVWHAARGKGPPLE